MSERERTEAERDAFLNNAEPSNLPLKGPGKLFVWMPPVSFRKLARIIDGTKWEARIAGVSLGRQWGVFVVWRRPRIESPPPVDAVARAVDRVTG